jgi:hypothetical protein
MIVGDGAGFNYSVDVLVNLDLNVVEFLRRFRYDLYVIIISRYCLLKFVLLDSFYREKVGPTHKCLLTTNKKNLTQDQGVTANQ